MEYKGKLYGKVGKVYFPLEKTTDDIEELEKNILNDDKARIIIENILTRQMDSWHGRGVTDWDYEMKQERVELFGNLWYSTSIHVGRNAGVRIILKRKMMDDENDVPKDQWLEILMENIYYHFIDIYEEAIQMTREHVDPVPQDLKFNPVTPDDMCFHECPNCNCRCNCLNQPCSCCNEA